jgi:signal transduction histidine kinase
VREISPFGRFRMSSVALAIALVLALGGVFAIDRTLSSSNRAEATLEAAQSAALVQGFLAVHAEALQSAGGLYLDTANTEWDKRSPMVLEHIVEYGLHFRRIWATDSSGLVRSELLVGPPGAIPPRGMDLDTIQTLGFSEMSSQARRTRRIQVSRVAKLFSGEESIVIMVPMYVADRFAGFMAGSVPATALLLSVDPGAVGQLALVAGMDTIRQSRYARTGAASPYQAKADVRVPGGQRWSVIVYTSPENKIRLLLWGVGLATLGALIVALIHERRQGTRLEDRSIELERLSSELLVANKSKSEFLASVSHELRTPLNAIVGFVELLRDGVYGDLNTRQIGPVDRIASSANHLRHLVDQILDIAKMAAGRLDVHAEPIDLRPFILDVAAELESLVAEQGLGLSISVGGTLPKVRTDPMHLRQILLNLLGNAIKNTPSGGIAVRARLVKEDLNHVEARRPTPDGRKTAGGPLGNQSLWIAVQVADSGVGVDAGDLERIFDEFEQVNAGSRGNSAQRGTGLGLSISRRLARVLGGDITVESELGKGSTFTLWLPVNRADFSVASQERIGELAAGSGGGAP